MENTFEEYKEWTGGEVDSDIQHVYKKAVTKLQERKPFEDELVRQFFIIFYLLSVQSCNTSSYFIAVLGLITAYSFSHN